MKRRASFAPMKSTQKPMWFWLAFPDSGQACIVQGETIPAAIQQAWRLESKPIKLKDFVAAVEQLLDQPRK